MVFILTSPVQHIFSRAQMLGTSSCCCMNMPGPTCRMMVPSPSAVHVGHWSRMCKSPSKQGERIAGSQREKKRRREESVYADVRRIKNPLSIPKWMYNRCPPAAAQKMARLTIHHPAGRDEVKPMVAHDSCLGWFYTDAEKLNDVSVSF